MTNFGSLRQETNVVSASCELLGIGLVLNKSGTSPSMESVRRNSHCSRVPQARTDFDTSTYAPNPGGLPYGPHRYYYFVRTITQLHEDTHVSHFYSQSFTFWYTAMQKFEAQDVEASSVNVIYDCNDATTTTGNSADLRTAPR